MTCDGKTMTVNLSTLRAIDGDDDPGWGRYCIALTWLAMDEIGAIEVSSE